MLLTTQVGEFLIRIAGDFVCASQKSAIDAWCIWWRDRMRWQYIRAYHRCVGRGLAMR